MDRTVDFHAIVQELCQSRGGAAAAQQRDAPQPSKLSQHVTTVSKALHETSMKLGQLTKLVRHRGMLRDAGAAINTLTQSIKGDITMLDEHLTSLEAAAAPGDSPALAAHRAAMVDTLQHKLVAATSTFHTVLKDRTAAMRSVADRQRVFGGAARLGRPVAYAPPALPTPAAGGAGETTPLLGSGGGQGGGATAPSLGAFAQVNMQAVEASRGADQYFDARASEAAAVEGMVAEMGGLFKRLAGVVAEQGEALGRLEDQAATALDRLEAGQQQLQQHHDSVMDNRWLAAKVGGILVAFGVVFTVFIA